MVGGFQRPTVDPNWIPSAEGMQCLSGHWTVLSPWAGTPRQPCHALTTGVQLHCAPVPQLLCTNHNRPSTAHVALRSHTAEAQGKGSPSALKMDQMAWLAATCHLNPAPSGTESSPGPSGSVSCSSCLSSELPASPFLSKHSKTLTKFRAVFFHQLTLLL